MPDWITHNAEAYDFSFGTRFHGNMAAWQAGVPALWLVHDSRTVELCDYLALPYIQHSDFRSDITIDELKSAADYSCFFNSFPSRLQAYLGYLEACGVREGLDPGFKSQVERWLPGGDAWT
ncbi:MAG: hypothetical protein ABGX16_00615 [Pirellulales bacterium]